MQSKEDKITIQMPEFSMSFKDDFFYPLDIIFKGTYLYQLFKSYLESTKYMGRNPEFSLADSGRCKFDDQAKHVDSSGLNPRIIGKFFLETDLDWPKEYYDAQNSSEPKYKQPLMPFHYYSTDYDKEYAKGGSKVSVWRREEAEIPEHIMKMMINYSVNSKNIKKFTPLLLQAKRNPSFFTKLPQEILPLIANHLEPHLSLEELTAKRNDELASATVFYQKIRPVSYEKEKIGFSKFNGTHLSLDVSDFFKIWFAELPLKEGMSLGKNHKLFKLNEQTLVINSGLSTPGIQIKKESNGFIACNNLTADKPNLLKLEREENLVNLLTIFKNNFQLLVDKVEEIKQVEVVEESQSTTCSIQ